MFFNSIILHIVDYIRIFAAFNINYHVMKKENLSDCIERQDSISCLSDCYDCPLFYDLKVCGYGTRN